MADDRVQIDKESGPQHRATPDIAQGTLVREIDRWAPIIKAAGQYAD